MVVSAARLFLFISLPSSLPLSLSASIPPPLRNMAKCQVI